MSMNPLQTRAEPGDRCLRFRAGMLCCGVVTVFSLFSWRLIHLQCDQHAYFQGVLEKTHHKTQDLSASRGDILDTRGRVLACDEPVQQVTLELNFLQVGSTLASAIAGVEGMKATDLRHAFSLEQLQNRYLKHLGHVAAPMLGMTEEEFEGKVRARLNERSTGEVFLTRELSVSSAIRLREMLEEAKLGTYRENRNRGTLGALVFQNGYARRYPADLPLTHIVGMFGESGGDGKPARGVAGAERFFDSSLTGTPGKRELEVDGWGNEVPAYRGAITPPVNGRGVRLSLDLGLQGLLEQVLDESGNGENDVYLDELHAEKVTVVLFDPQTMGVRAIGVRDAKHDPKKPMLNNPVTEMLYEPGSTIKIVAVSGAISSGKVNGNTMINLGSGGVWDDDDITPIHDEHSATSLSVEDILVHSS
ncbi:MAG: ftsI, partial [Verrucomicrobiales bacterium]|nr:ftsI [Verrucomicrobiales bacterium]